MRHPEIEKLLDGCERPESTTHIYGTQETQCLSLNDRRRGFHGQGLRLARLPDGYVMLGGTLINAVQARAVRDWLDWGLR